MLEGVYYCPTLYARAAEIKALFQLSSLSKDRIFPLIIGRPWPNAKQLERTWKKIGEALGSRRYALDLDRMKRNILSEKPAQADFDKLFDSKQGFINYYILVKSLENVVPVLRLEGGMAPDLAQQLHHVIEIDRGLIVRIEYDYTFNYANIVDIVCNSYEDVVICIDVGWSNDILSREVWASNVIAIVSQIKPEIEIIITGSSFPDSFVDLAERGVTPVRERSLFSNLTRRHNAASLLYGDWGSTRPPTDPTPMRNTPRIDLPTNRQWISFRQDHELDDDETYSDIAKRMLEDVVWPANLNIWGTYTIACTANDLPGAIRSPAVAAAARINIHMHQQAFFGSTQVVSDGDEPYRD